MAALFTPEELAELARIDAELESETITYEEIRESRERDKATRQARKGKNAQKIEETHRKYYEANREKIAESQRAYREANREKIAANWRVYYAENREQIAERKRAYYAANPDKHEARKAYMREYYRRHKERKASTCLKSTRAPAPASASRDGMAI